MKEFLKGLVRWKTSACMIFTAAIFIYLFFCLIYGTREVSTAMLWGLFWVSAAGSLIQAVCFSDWLIKKAGVHLAGACCLWPFSCRC